MTTSKEPDEIIEFVDSVAWVWVLVAFGFGIAAGIVILALIGRERETPNA